MSTSVIFYAENVDTDRQVLNIPPLGSYWGHAEGIRFKEDGSLDELLFVNREQNVFKNDAHFYNPQDIGSSNDDEAYIKIWIWVVGPGDRVLAKGTNTSFDSLTGLPPHWVE